MEVLRQKIGVAFVAFILVLDVYGVQKKDPIGTLLSGIIEEIIGIHRNIASWDTLKVIALTYPFFVGSRMIDDKVQSCFYEFHEHKNRYKVPRWCHDIAEWIVAAPMIFCAIEAVLARDDEFRETCRTFFVGMPFVISGKDILKSLRFDACLRPWNEKFDCGRRASGGFPSGHIAEATYAAVIFGMRYGPKAAIPLGAIAVGIAATFVSCNRHYISQMVAGAGLGAIYGLAANKFIDEKLGKICTVGFSTDPVGNIAAQLTYSF